MQQTPFFKISNCMLCFIGFLVTVQSTGVIRFSKENYSKSHSKSIEIHFVAKLNKSVFWSIFLSKNIKYIILIIVLSIVNSMS